MGNVEELLIYEDGIPNDLLDELNTSYEVSFTYDDSELDQAFNSSFISEEPVKEQKQDKENIHNTAAANPATQQKPKNTDDDTLNALWLLAIPLLFFLIWVYLWKPQISPLPSLRGPESTEAHQSTVSVLRNSVNYRNDLALEKEGAQIMRSCTTPPKQPWWCNHQLTDSLWDLSWLPQCSKLSENTLIRSNSLECWPLTEEFSIGISLGRPAKVFTISLQTEDPVNWLRVREFSVYSLSSHGLFKLTTVQNSLTVNWLSPKELSSVVVKGHIDGGLTCAQKLEVVGYFEER